MHFTDRRRHLLNGAGFFNDESLRQKSLVDQLHNTFIVRLKPDRPKMLASYFHPLQVSSQRLTLDSTGVGRWPFGIGRLSSRRRNVFSILNLIMKRKLAVYFLAFMSGAQFDQVKLTDAANPEEFTRRIAAQATKTPKGEWILGGRWDETKWPTAQLPTKELVDPVTEDTPIFVERYDGHEALANSAAMKLAGVDAKTPDVPGGVIMRDASGNPTGIFKD